MKATRYAVALSAASAPPAGAAEIKVIASNAVREPYRELIPIFENSTGHKVTIDWGGTFDIVRRVGGGEIADIVIIPVERIDDFVKSRLLVSRIDVARSGVGVAVRAGAPRPDISSVRALRSSLLAAKSIVLSSGPSSVYLPTLFQKMGIADHLKPKIIKIGPGLPVGETVARGDGEIKKARRQLFQHAVALDRLIARMQRGEFHGDAAGPHLARRVANLVDGLRVALEIGVGIGRRAGALPQHVERIREAFRFQPAGALQGLPDRLAEDEVMAKDTHRLLRRGADRGLTQPFHQAAEDALGCVAGIEETAGQAQRPD